MNAESFSLGLTPPVITVVTTQPNLIKKDLTIENFSEIPISLDVSFREFSLGESGEIVYQPDSPAFSNFLKHLSLENSQGSPIKQLVLDPKQSQQVTLKADLYPTDPDGIHLFSIIFQESAPKMLDNQAVSDEQTSSTTILGGIATNVVFQIGKNLSPEAEIAIFSTSSIVKNGPVAFTLGIRNTGKQFVQSKGVIKIKNIFGNTVGKVEVPERIILAGRTRIIDQDINEKLGSAIQNINSTRGDKVIGNLYWRDPVFFGPYTAVAEIAIGNDQPPLVQSANFFVFPTYALFTSIILLLFLAWLTNRVRRHLHA